MIGNRCNWSFHHAAHGFDPGLNVRSEMFDNNVQTLPPRCCLSLSSLPWFPMIHVAFRTGNWFHDLCRSLRCGGAFSHPGRRDPAFAGHAAVVRTADDQGRHSRQPDGMEGSQHQWHGGRQNPVAGQGDNPALHVPTRGDRPRPLQRQSTMIRSSAPGAPCWSASAAWEKL